jgi:hypothetical protein
MMLARHDLAILSPEILLERTFLLGSSLCLFSAIETFLSIKQNFTSRKLQS